MCSYQTLFHDDNTGYVVRCGECCKLQIGFGNLMLTVNEEGFASFRWVLKKIRDEQPENLRESLRCIVVPTPCEGVNFLLSLRELWEFNAMLESADTELQSLALMKLFNT
jgi:hypothetical protein